MKNTRLKWLLLIAALVLAIAVGCTSNDDDEPALLSSDEEYAENAPEDAARETLMGEYVATINGIGITASEVYDVENWAANMLVQEYIAMFPEDMDFNFEHIFRDGKTFGQVLREESARLAAMIKMFEEYANQHGLPFDNSSDHNHVIDVVIFTILDEPAMHAEFLNYMAEIEDSGATERAMEIWERIQQGEDFDELMFTYSEDPGLASFPNGYTFVAEQMVPEFSAGTLALAIGEIGEPVRSDFGYHIIKRVEPIPEEMFFELDVPEEDMLGAKHILIADDTPSYEEMLIDAIFDRFEAMVENNIVLLPALDGVGVGQ